MTNLLLTENQTTNFEKAIAEEMDKSIHRFEKELATIRTGRANPAIVEDVKVACYDTVMALKELAVLTAPDVSLIVIQPWDKSLISHIEEAISNR